MIYLKRKEKCNKLNLITTHDKCLLICPDYPEEDLQKYYIDEYNKRNEDDKIIGFEICRSKYYCAYYLINCADNLRHGIDLNITRPDDLYYASLEDILDDWIIVGHTRYEDDNKIHFISDVIDQKE